MAKTRKISRPNQNEFAVALSALEDNRNMIAAGKVQRWDVVKWAVTVDLALSAAAITLRANNRAFFVVATMTSIAAWLLVWHYNRRMTGARTMAKTLIEWLKENGIDYSQIQKVDIPQAYKQKRWNYDKEELIIFAAILFIALF
jgi:hypothetical protein